MRKEEAVERLFDGGRVKKADICWGKLSSRPTRNSQEAEIIRYSTWK